MALMATDDPRDWDSDPDTGRPVPATAETAYTDRRPDLLPGEDAPAMGPGQGFTYGMEAPAQDMTVIATQIDRLVRAKEGMREWAELAKVCTEFVEGQQWTEEQRRAMEDSGRPAVTLNKIGPLHRFLMGHFLQNRYELRFLPGQDGSGIQPVAEALSQVAKQVDEANGSKWNDGEVFSDGIVTGRGYYDYRLDFARNMLGEIRERVLSPFSTLIDPEAETYHPNGWEWCGYDRWMSAQDIEAMFGRSVSELVYGSGVFGSQPITAGADIDEQPEPSRYFGQDLTFTRDLGGLGAGAYGGVIDNAFSYLTVRRKLIRVTEVQHRIYSRGLYFVDLETGDKKLVPANFTRKRIAKIMEWAQANNMPLSVQPMTEKRIRWTVTAGDRLLYDDWSPYRTFTIVPFFPYFRRGKTRGMIEDLLDPQREVNKRRSVMLHIISTMANSGWLWEEGSLDAENQTKVEDHGAVPGLSLQYRKDRPAPTRITPMPPPTGYERAEQAATNDLKEVSGINDSALGMKEGEAHSGRAIIARQKSAIVGAEMYFDNFSRSRQVKGEKILELIQDFYTEPRIVRTLGENGDPIKTYINSVLPSGKIMNDVTLGSYTAVVDEAPMSATFQNAQFEAAMEMIGAGIQIPPDMMIDLAPLPRKDELKARMAEQARFEQEQAALNAAMGPPQGGQPGKRSPSGPRPGPSQQGQNLTPGEMA